MEKYVLHSSGYLSVPKINSKAHHNLFYNCYQPKNAPVKATLLILHGMQEHSGRYAALATYLARQGVVVMVYDHLGHGKTAQNEEELVFFQNKNAKEQLVNDALKMGEFLRNMQPQVPHFLLGHSMGSFVARCVVQQKKLHFDGALLVGTGAKVVGIGVVKMVLSICSFFAPKRRSRWVNGLFAQMNNKQFKNETDGDTTSWLSVSKSNRAAFVADPLNGVPFTNNGFHTLIGLNQQATRRHWAQNRPKDFPFLFVSGEDDPIGDFGKGIRRTVQQLKKDGFQCVDGQLYPKMRHEILNEINKEEVFAFINQWINKTIKII